MSNKPSLLLPAGNMRTLKTALRFGADAVYCGLTAYGLRAQAANFSEQELNEAVRLCHSRGAEINVTLNIFAKDADCEGMLQAAKKIRDAGADAVIVSDLGMIAAIASQVSGLQVHVSTQANCTNAQSALVYRSLGASRVVLARELTLNEIEKMAEELDGRIELETFVQMTYFDRILERANIRFRMMTDGQYEMERRKKAENKRSQTGLDIDVIDYHNGEAVRSISTLSGGESFKASLSLALGLADEVQSSAGGVRLDTMFVDEGFGTLDDESLNNAIKALYDLSEGNRLVGIISHVKELENRIDKKIVITKDVVGSHAKVIEE